MLALRASGMCGRQGDVTDKTVPVIQGSHSKSNTCDRNDVQTLIIKFFAREVKL